MGYDCTLHLIDAERIRAVFCARADVSAALAGGDPAEAAHEIARAAIQFSAAELPAHYERGFCLSLWGWRMEDDAQLAEVPKKLRGSAADLDALFAPLVEAHPRLKGRWPLELSGNGSVGIYVPAEKVPGLLKWARRKVASYPKPDRRVFRGLLRVLAECERRGLAYWEGSEVATVHHPLEAPADERADWLEHVLLPRKGTWRLTANVAAPPEPPLCVFDFLGLENFLTEPPGCAVADLKVWPPAWVTLDEALTPCDRGRDGRWVVVSRREADVTWRSAPRAVELRETIEARGQVIEVPMSPAAWNYLRWQGVPEEAAATSTPAVDFVGMVGGLPVVLVRTGNLPPILGGPGNDAPVPPFRPHVWRGGSLREADELPASVISYESARLLRLPDGADVLVWMGRGYEVRDGRFERTFELWPQDWRGAPSGSAPVGADAILAQAYLHAEKRGELFLSRRGEAPRQVAPAVKDLSELAVGPDGGVLARQIGPRPQHLGCVLWPEQGTGGVVLWIDDDLFPDEDPEDIDHLLGSASADRLIAVTSKRLWAVPMERVTRSPRHDATTGRKLRGK